MGNTGEEQGWGALVGVGFVFVEVDFHQEKEKSQDHWRNMRLPSLTQSPRCGFFFSWREKKTKRKLLEALWGVGEEGNLNGLNYQKNTAFKI